uniref:NADH-ubiquinone oxidoreductase chain 4L n=1 Tax=Thylaeodus sp. TAR-2010 TaxID=765162 RepID=E2FLV9_9CAEN|nr:NADH dehydrogenase subunit 4L [Thylaeodus sp. TAR-2010]
MGMYYLSVCGVGFICSIVGLALQYKHLLGVLLMLEAALMNLFFLLFLFSSLQMCCYSSLIFVSLSACEASLGLSVLVALVRAHGNDYVSSFSTLV